MLGQLEVSLILFYRAPKASFGSSAKERSEKQVRKDWQVLGCSLAGKAHVRSQLPSRTSCHLEMFVLVYVTACC